MGLSASVLLAHEVAPWTDLPLWIPENSVEGAGLMKTDASRARDAGLRFRPLAETVADTSEWARSRPTRHDLAAGMAATKEEAILRAFRQRDSGS